METFWNCFNAVLGIGLEPKNLTFLQISLRGVIVLLATLVMVRIGHKRSLARKTAFDAVLLVILASVLSRAINGSAAFYATLGGGFVIVLFHRLLAWAAYYSHGIGLLLKGAPEIIVENGMMKREVMRSNHVSQHDLEEDLRLDAHSDKLEEIRVARIERSGDISFIKKPA
jgi:Predicted membrane protein